MRSTGEIRGTNTSAASRTASGTASASSGGWAIDHRVTAVLGIVTIAAYGVWYYSFGALLDPIREDTGWRESSLAASFSIGVVLTGIGSLVGGRALDRFGHRLVFATAAVCSAGSFVVASFAESPGLFVIAAAVGQGFVGAFGFYHITMTTAVRLQPEAPARAIAALTIWGAFASAIFLPFTTALVDAIGWRSTVRVLAAIGAAALSLAVVALPAPVRPAATSRPSMRSVLAAAVAPGPRRWFAVAASCGGIAMSTLLVYQVPTMTSLGLPAATAATFAGVRGVAQLGGRLPLGRLLDRFGVDASLVLAFGAIAAGAGLLAIAGSVVAAAGFALVAGFGIGAFSPLQGIKSQELFDGSSLGATMGAYGALMMAVGAAGPAIAGVLADATGDRRWATVIAGVAGLAAAASVWFGVRTPEGDGTTPVDGVASG